jgi:magnesium transporter
MIKGYSVDGGILRPVDDVLANLAGVVWIDMLAPTEAEEIAVERSLAVDIPTREEMEEIEASSRLYYYEGAVFMTATLPAHADRDDPLMAPVTFVLTGERLITVRYHDPRPFQMFPQRGAKAGVGGSSAQAVLMALLESVVERLADILERAARDIDGISHTVFRHATAAPGQTRDFQKVIEEVGRKGDLLSDIRDSLMTLGRLFGFLGQVVPPRGGDATIRSRLKSLIRDGRSLTDHASFLSQKITFLLDATLGMINIQQNAIIKIFSVAAVVFLPPTLVASIYGMNFDSMPELGWPLGYPLALVLMGLSAILPYWYFKRRGWL